jgi:hypothetical protein
MSEEISVEYYCPYCETETILIINAESPSDYTIVDECCPNCDAQIEGGVIDKLAYDAVSDHFAIQGGYHKDIYQNLD